MNKNIVIVLLLTFLSISCKRNDQEIKVGYLPITLSLPLFVAIEQGYFKEYGLNVDPINYATADQLTNALAAGNVDITSNTSTSTFFKVNDNIPDFAKIYLVSIHTPENYLDALIVGKNSGIDSISQLVGKKIGIFPGSTNVLYLSIALSNFIDPSKVEMIQLPPQTHIEALANGQVDAIYTLEPIVTLAISKGIGKELIKGSNSTYLVNPFPGGVFLVSSKFLKMNKNQFKDFLKATEKAVNFIKNNPVIARSYFTKYTPIDSTLAQQLHLGDWWTLKQIQKENIDSLTSILIDNKYIEKFPQKDIYYNSAE
jgi:NitT/TauT family transport system substrate-binding protein